jgi:hypothetical protein
MTVRFTQVHPDCRSLFYLLYCWLLLHDCSRPHASHKYIPELAFHASTSVNIQVPCFMPACSRQYIPDCCCLLHVYIPASCYCMIVHVRVCQYIRPTFKFHVSRQYIPDCCCLSCVLMLLLFTPKRFTPVHFPGAACSMYIDAGCHCMTVQVQSLLVIHLRLFKYKLPLLAPCFVPQEQVLHHIGWLWQHVPGSLSEGPSDCLPIAPSSASLVSVCKQAAKLPELATSAFPS